MALCKNSEKAPTCLHINSVIAAHLLHGCYINMAQQNGNHSSDQTAQSDTSFRCAPHRLLVLSTWAPSTRLTQSNACLIESLLISADQPCPITFYLALPLLWLVDVGVCAHPR